MTRHLTVSAWLTELKSGQPPRCTREAGPELTWPKNFDRTELRPDCVCLAPILTPGSPKYWGRCLGAGKD